MSTVIRKVKFSIFTRSHAWCVMLTIEDEDEGVNDKTIQAILRHANVMTTMDIYVKTVSADSTAAMKLLEGALCAQCAPTPAPGIQPVLN